MFVGDLHYGDLKELGGNDGDAAREGRDEGDRSKQHGDDDVHGVLFNENETNREDLSSVFIVLLTETNENKMREEVRSPQVYSFLFSNFD